MKNYLKFLGLLFVTLVMFTNCEDDTEVYDVTFPEPTITGVSTYSDFLSSTITLNGNFTKVKSVYFGSIEGENVVVAPNENSLTVVVPRSAPVNGAPIIVTNEFSGTVQTPNVFVPKIQMSRVLEVSDVQADLSFTVTGENIDLLTEVAVDGVKVSPVSTKIDVVKYSVSGMGLKPGQIVDISFKSLAKNNIATAQKIDVVYPFTQYSEVVIWDFEDNLNAYSGEGTSSLKTSNILDKEQKYFSLRAPGYGWDKESGNLKSETKPDFGNLVNPHITFAVRTPSGSAGYFQLQSPGAWRHFGYGFDTGGEWVIISQPLEENWEGNGWDPATFEPELSFKAGNAGDNQDVDIAYVKITEGRYTGSQEIGDPLVGSSKPSKIVLFDFENTSNFPDIEKDGIVVASLNFRKEIIDPFNGNEFFTYTDDGTLGNWGGYWSQTLSEDISNIDFSTFNNPFLSFAHNGIKEASQYITIRFFQYDGQLELVQKFFPNTNGLWETAQFDLFGTDMENWSKTDTQLGEHYATLKRINKNAPIERIEIIISRNDTNTIGISLDEFVITEGPRY